MDPPYKKENLLSCWKRYLRLELLNDMGYIVCEHGHDVTLPEQVGGLIIKRKEVYGIIAITIYQWEQFQEEV